MSERPEYPTEADLKHWFTYHSPQPGQAEKYESLRHWGFQLSMGILQLCPAGPDRIAAIRKVREAVMTANQAIACDGH